MKYKIMSYKLVFRGKDLLWLEESDMSKIKGSTILDSLLKVINRGKEKKITKKEFINELVIEKSSQQPSTFPKYDETMSLKIKGYNVYNPEIVEIIWTETNGWLYNFKNIGHRIQWIKESDIKRT